MNRLLENKTERQTVSFDALETRTPGAVLQMNRLLENKTERQTVSFDALETRTPGAARQTIESAAESEIGPTVHETGLKGTRLQRHQHATKDILAGNPVGQVEDAQEELFFDGSPFGNRCGATGTGKYGHQSNDNDTDQWMLPIDC
jgi:hypothetical protein